MALRLGMTSIGKNLTGSLHCLIHRNHDSYFTRYVVLDKLANSGESHIAPVIAAFELPLFTGLRSTGTKLASWA